MGDIKKKYFAQNFQFPIQIYNTQLCVRFIRSVVFFFVFRNNYHKFFECVCIFRSLSLSPSLIHSRTHSLCSCGVRQQEVFVEIFLFANLWTTTLAHRRRRRNLFVERIKTKSDLNATYKKYELARLR